MKRILGCISLLIFVLALNSGFAETEPSKPVKAKRVFTNDDLGKFRERFGSDTSADPVPAAMSTPEPQTSEGKSVLEKKATAGNEKSQWVGRLREAETAVQKAKADQTKYSQALEKYEQKSRDAQTDFQKTLSQNQVADSLKNLSRAAEEVRQAEEMKSKVLADAAKKGFRPEDLRESAEEAGEKKK
jgi:hypothetical protein